MDSGAHGWILWVLWLMWKFRHYRNGVLVLVKVRRDRRLISGQNAVPAPNCRLPLLYGPQPPMVLALHRPFVSLYDLMQVANMDRVRLGTSKDVCFIAKYADRRKRGVPQICYCPFQRNARFTATVERHDFKNRMHTMLVGINNERYAKTTTNGWRRQDRQQCSVWNSSCRLNCASAKWRVNRSISEHWFGTWRERHGYHMFMHFTNAPERAGYIAYGLWQHTIPLLCQQDVRLHCLASSLGSLYEYVLRTVNVAELPDRKALAFALHQCSRAIKLLTSVNQDNLDLQVALTACILLTHFESLQGYTRAAVLHCLQGRSLLAGIDIWAASGRHVYDPVWLTQLQGAVMDLELQARCVPGIARPDGDPISSLRQIRLPPCQTLRNVNHAGAVLGYAQTNLLNVLIKIKKAMGESYIARLTNERTSVYLPWLRSWDTVFESLVSKEHITARSRQRHNILRINHKILCILSEFDVTNGNTDWDVQVSYFELITSLSDSVLATYEIGINPSLSNEHFPFFTHGLWMLEPLFITVARCPDQSIRYQAAKILLTRRCLQTTTWSSRAAIVTTREDVHDIEDLIDFAKNTRLDIGLAMFFGGFQRQRDIEQDLA